MLSQAMHGCMMAAARLGQINLVVEVEYDSLLVVEKSCARAPVHGDKSADKTYISLLSEKMFFEFSVYARG